MLKFWNNFRSAFSLLSRIPLKDKHPGSWERLDFFLPLMGLLAAIPAVFAWIITWYLVSNILVAVLIAVLFQYLAFNLFHFDGLIDSADAMAGYHSKEKRFQILADPRAGAFGIFFGFMYLALKVALLVQLANYGSYVVIFALIAAPISGRCAAAFIPCLSTPAKAGGLASLPGPMSPLFIFFGWLLSCGGLLVVWLFYAATLLILVAMFASLCGAFISGLYIARVFRKKIGGYTGDALGSAVETGELFCLFIFFILVRNLPAF